MLQCHEKDINIAVDTGEDYIEERQLLEPLSSKQSDITISLVPAGSKGIGKVLAAVAIVATIYFVPILATQAGGMTTLAAGATSFGAKLGISIATNFAINLALTGFAEMMAPDPAVDKDAPTNYLFNGDAQAISEGDPVPILYGKLRVPGRPVSIEINTANRAFENLLFGYNFNFSTGELRVLHGRDE
jgi:predicted phage tail protein